MLTSTVFLCLVACHADSGNGGGTVAGGLQNLLIDPGFESDDAAWIHLQADDRSVVSFPTHSGDGAAEIQLHDRHDREIIQVLSVLPESLYSVSGWIKSSGINGEGGSVLLHWVDSGGLTIRIDSVATVTGTRDWFPFGGNFTSPPAAVQLQFRMSAANDPDGVGVMWVDDSTVIGAAGGANPTIALSTYVGGSQHDTLRDITFDDQGNIYFTGGVASTDFPTTAGAYDESLDTSGSLIHDIGVVKLASNGVVVWSTLVGGPEYDRAYAIEVDSQGFVYVAGRAGDGFPTSPGVVQPGFAGDSNPNTRYGPQDGVVVKISPDGSQVIWATYFGGPDRSFIRDMDIDEAGNVYVILTAVSEPLQHITPGAYQTVLPPVSNGVIAKISSTGGQVAWATYMGASSLDMGTPSIRVNSAGEAIVAGVTNSPDLPTTNGAYQSSFAGVLDMYIAKLSADGRNLRFATYFGGADSEFTETHCLSLDSFGNVVLAATTTSTDLDFTPSAFQRFYAGSGGADTGGATNYPGDGFVAKFSGVSGSLIHGTYLGGQFGEGIEGVMLDGADNVYVSGATFSNDFPITVDAFQSSKSGDADFFAAKLSPDLTTLEYGTFAGGNDKDYCRSSAVNPDGTFYICGHTESSDWPVVNAFQPVKAGDDDGAIIVLRPGALECTSGDGTACDDTDPCTSNDICKSGYCVGTPLDCSVWDGACFTGVCNSSTGQCEPILNANGTPCEADNDPCTTNGECVSGFCMNEQSMNCDDGIDCTTDSCTVGGCVHAPNHSFCSTDNLFCTGQEFCDPSIGCTSDGNPCNDPANCDEATDSCGCEAPVVIAEGPRYLTIRPPYADSNVAIYVLGIDAEVGCVEGYVQANGTLGDNPVYRPANGDGGWGTIHLHDEELVAGMSYEVQADCGSSVPGLVVSDYAQSTLWAWGDVDGSLVVDIIDITRVVDGFRSSVYSSISCITDADCISVLPNQKCDMQAGRCLRVIYQNVDLIGPSNCQPDGVVDVMDITRSVDAFRGFADPCTISCP